MKKSVLKILSFILTLLFVLSGAQSVFAYSISTQEFAVGVDTVSSLEPFAEFNSKITDGAYIIPGLNSTSAYDKNTKLFTSCKTMTPQSFCTVGHYTLITAYDSDDLCTSVIYVLDYDRTLIKTLILPDSYHAGGIAYDGVNQVILVTKPSAQCLGVISLDDFNGFMRLSNSFVKIKYTVSKSTADVNIAKASGVTCKNGRVYISNFEEGSLSTAYCYIPSYDSINKTYTLSYQYKFSVPDYTQGITITEYKEKTRLFASASYGRNSSKNIYCSYLYTYTFDELTGEKELDNVLACPPMLQQASPSGGKLYCLFESACALYRKSNDSPIDLVIPIKLSRICDEEKGSAININSASVNDGKSISIETGIENAEIYYASYMPYISYKKIKYGNLYSKPYTKTSSGRIWAVAVLDGRIVGADTLYVTVSKAAAPSKLKVTSYSSKAVNLKWNKADSADGYYIFRSTKKDSGYAKIATLAKDKTVYKDKKVKKNKTYYYKVRAYRKGYSNSSFANIVKIKTKKS